MCYQLFDIRESLNGNTVKTVTECEGSQRISHSYLSSSHSVFIEITVAKILNVHFLVHFKGLTIELVSMSRQISFVSEPTNAHY